MSDSEDRGGAAGSEDSEKAGPVAARSKRSAAAADETEVGLVSKVSGLRPPDNRLSRQYKEVRAAGQKATWGVAAVVVTVGIVIVVVVVGGGG